MKFLLTSCLVLFSFLGSFLYSQDPDSILFANSNFKRVTVNIHFVSTLKNQLVSNQVTKELSEVFKNSKIDFRFLRYNCSDKKNPEIFTSPIPTSYSYTRQMRTCRDIFFKDKHDKNDNDYYIFLVGDFSDKNTLGFAIPNKHVSFVKYSDLPNFSKSISSCLLRTRGVPILSDSSALAVQNINKLLTWKECLELRQSTSFFQLLDDYELVNSNNGLVAYYLWNEDRNGNIILAKDGNFINSITRPFKRNYTIVHLKIVNPLFWQLYSNAYFVLSPLHLLVLVLVLFLLLYLRKKVNARILKSSWYKRWLFRIFKFIMVFVSMAIIGSAFYFVNKYYSYHFLENHQFDMFKNYSLKKVLVGLGNHPDLIKKNQGRNVSEIVICKKGNWTSRNLKAVLYFDIQENRTGKATMVFKKSANQLIIAGRNYPTFNHYFVFTRRSVAGSVISQTIYDFKGKEIVPTLFSKNPSKRILLFVNGYRPVSTSSDLEKTFSAIQAKGLEIPESSHHIYDNDRFAYWSPWKNFNLLFENRIQADNVYYADGHHSISTSNYTTLLNFSNAMAFYPKPCKNLNAHHCFQAANFSNSMVNSLSMLPTIPNIGGFNTRRKNGRMAGINLLQLLNEMPNRSNNDTIYMVAHSMGYAYALGIIEVLSKNIKFGGFYIFAPENASSGGVNSKQWDEVWQYGSNLTNPPKEAPCLQDGIAPQFNVKGLPSNNIIHFPSELNKFRGFSASHFIGNYTWIFDIPSGQRGAVKRN